MNLNRYHKSGGMTQQVNLTPSEANRRFEVERPYLTHRYSNTYRLTLTDPLAGDRIIRDSDDYPE